MSHVVAGSRADGGDCGRGIFNTPLVLIPPLREGRCLRRVLGAGGSAGGCRREAAPPSLSVTPLEKLLITLMRDRFDRLEVLAQREEPRRVAARKVTAVFMDAA